jgi:hypothetical protein
MLKNTYVHKDKHTKMSNFYTPETWELNVWKFAALLLTWSLKTEGIFWPTKTPQSAHLT